jgi:uncharacterized membrane protein YfcA
MYLTLLLLHNLVRWIIVILAIYALYNNYNGWRNGRVYAKKDKTLNGIFIGSLHLQIVLGIILYFGFSPFVSQAMEDMKTAMKDSTLRFWAVEHILGMIIAVAVAQIGNIVSKKSATDTEKFRKAFIYFLIAVIIIFLSHPFAFHGGARPLNPFDRIG